MKKFLLATFFVALVLIFSTSVAAAPVAPQQETGTPVVLEIPDGIVTTVEVTILSEAPVGSRDICGSYTDPRIFAGGLEYALIDSDGSIHVYFENGEIFFSYVVFEFSPPGREKTVLYQKNAKLPISFLMEVKGFNGKEFSSQILLTFSEC